MKKYRAIIRFISDEMEFEDKEEAQTFFESDAATVTDFFSMITVEDVTVEDVTVEEVDE